MQCLFPYAILYISYFMLEKKNILTALLMLVAIAMYGNGPSGTLPVVYIETENGTPVDQKEVYINAVAHIDALGIEGYENLGTAEEPVALCIRGRGQSSWTMLPKKPYKIKFDVKQEVLGMGKSKHWALLTLAWGGMCQFSTKLGLEVSRMLDMAWTPEMTPVELVLNDQYMGLYWLAETVRIEKGRVEIDEQPENNVDEAEMPYGWLVEIDNYKEDESVVIKQSDGRDCIFKIHDPEPMNDGQREWITEYLKNLTDIISDSDRLSREWEQYINPQVLVRYFIAQELLNNDDSFVGSTYFYKSREDNGRLQFGPVWDMGDLAVKKKQAWNSLLYPRRQVWIRELAEYPAFWTILRQQWSAYSRSIDIEALCAGMDSLAERIEKAIECDYSRWPDLPNARDNVSVYKLAEDAKSYIKSAYQWLDARIWSDFPTFTVNIESPQGGDILINGQKCHMIEVMAGSDICLDFVAKDNYELDFPQIDGINYKLAIEPGNRITLKNVQSPHTIDAWFPIILSGAEDAVTEPSGDASVMPQVEAACTAPGEVTVRGETAVMIHDINGNLIYGGKPGTLKIAPGIYAVSAEGHSPVKIYVR